MADTDIPETNGESYDNGKHDSSNFNNPKTVKSDSRSSFEGMLFFKLQDRGSNSLGNL